MSTSRLSTSKLSTSSKSAGHSHRPVQKERDGQRLVASAGVSKATSQPKQSCSKVEREVIELKKENAALKKELTETKAMYSQLVQESGSENLSERRVCLLKVQVIQLERQVLILTQALTTRSQLLQDLHTMLDSLLEQMTRLSSPDVGCIADTAKSMKGRIAKCKQACSVEGLAQPLMFLNSFVQDKKPSAFSGEGPPPAVTLIDVCSGSSEHINLRHVNRLESKLALLYQSLLELQAAFQTTPTTGITMPTPHQQATPTSPSLLLQPVEAHQHDHVTKSCKLIGECCHHLLCLSLLVPAANWPPLKGREVSMELKADTIMGKFPAGIRQRKEVKEVVEAASKAYSYHIHMAELKCTALEKELEFHKSVYQLQVSYVSSLFEAVRNGYETFEQSAQELIITPLKHILGGYDALSCSTSEESLRKFLQLFKEHSSQLQHAVDCMSASSSASEEGGGRALSAYGEAFFQRLKELEAECSLQRHQQQLLQPGPSRQS